MFSARNQIDPKDKHQDAGVEADQPAAVEANDNIPIRAHHVVNRTASSTLEDSRTAYLWLDAGQASSPCKGPETLAGSPGWLVAAPLCACLVALLIWRGSSPLEATSQMELMAEKLQSMRPIPATTAREIARVIRQPWYDCDRVACPKTLEARNRAARQKLSDLLTTEQTLDRITASEP